MHLQLLLHHSSSLLGLSLEMLVYLHSLSFHHLSNTLSDLFSGKELVVISIATIEELVGEIIDLILSGIFMVLLATLPIVCRVSMSSGVIIGVVT